MLCHVGGSISPSPSHPAGPCSFLVALAFNSFPDYEDVESWEGGLRVFSRLCCFGNVLHEEVMEER